ncbi:MAG: DUF2437 domain-containing protein [Thermodesulfobacteriota bacterium]
MKLARFSDNGFEGYGIIESDFIVEIKGIGSFVNTVRSSEY